MERNRRVFWKYRKSGKEVLISENLTRKEAQKIVQKDVDSKPSVKVKMMVFDYMEAVTETLFY